MDKEHFGLLLGKSNNPPMGISLAEFVNLIRTGTLGML